MYSKTMFRRYVALFIGLSLLLSGIAPVGASRGIASDEISLWGRAANGNDITATYVSLLRRNKSPSPPLGRISGSAVPQMLGFGSDESDDSGLEDIKGLWGDAKKYASWFSDARDAINILETAGQVLGWIQKDDPNKVIKDHIDKIGSSLSVHFDRKLFDEHLGAVQNAVDKAKTWVDELDKREDLRDLKYEKLFLDAINPSEIAVNAEANSNSKRIYKKPNYKPWMSIIRDRPTMDENNEVYDWRIGAPTLMQLVAQQLQVFAVLDPNFRSDHRFDSQLKRYRDALLTHYEQTKNGVKCGYFSGENTDGWQLACADIYTGNAAYDKLPVSLSLSKTEKELSEKLAYLRREVQRKMPLFELRSMIDTLYLYITGEPDLTELRYEIRLQSNSDLCLDIKGSQQGEIPGKAGTPVLVGLCDKRDGQRWVYDRKGDTVRNVVYDKLLDVQWANPLRHTPVWIWDYNGTDAQRWTYDPEKHVLQNALGKVLSLKGAIQPEALAESDGLYLSPVAGQQWFNPWYGHPVLRMSPLNANLHVGEFVHLFLLDETSTSSIPPGSYSFEPVPPDQYDVPEGHTKGLPPGLLIDQSSGKISGYAQAEPGTQFDANFFVVNTQGEKVAEIGVSIQMADASEQVASLVGALDTVNCRAIGGQAWDKTQPRRVVSVDIYDGNTKLETVYANQPPNFPNPVANTREIPGSTVQNVVNPDVIYHGFNYRVPDSLKDGKQHLISVKFSGTSVHLNHSPMSRSINPAPLITSQPVSVTTCVGASATFSVVAIGAGLTYQWRKNGTPIAGATSPSLTIGSASVGDAGSYNVVLFNGCSTLISDEASLTVNAAPAITSQPADAPTCQGQPVTFSVTATGADLHYQWRKDGRLLTGETGSSLTIRSVRPNDTGSYDVVVSGSCGQSVTSRKATLTTNNAIQITKQPVNVTECRGQSVTFSVAATGANLRYLWRKNGGNIAGAEGSSYTIHSITAADAGSYSVVVYNGCGTANSAAATLSVSNAPLSLSDMGQVFDASGGDGSVNVSGCGAWNAVSNVPWATIRTGKDGNGSGTVAYSVTANTSNLFRSGVLTIAGKPYNLTQKPAPLTNDSQFIIQSGLQTMMTAGESRWVSIKMKNTGASTWTTANGYRLVSQAPVNNLTWGLSEVALPSSIPPGGEVTFTLPITAPSVSGTYRFEWRVMQGPLGFGAFSPAIDIRVTR